VRPRLLQHGQSLRVVERITANGDRYVVATVLTLHPDPFGYPPDGGVIKQHRFGERLQNVDEIVVAPDVGELVRENRLDLRWCQCGQRRDRKQNRWTQPANNRRNVHKS